MTYKDLTSHRIEGEKPCEYCGRPMKNPTFVQRYHPECVKKVNDKKRTVVVFKDTLEMIDKIKNDYNDLRDRNDVIKFLKKRFDDYVKLKLQRGGLKK